MFWRPRKPEWLIDPSKVALGSVVQNGGQSLSRSHVRVKYHHVPQVQFVPLATFIRRCNEVMHNGRRLDIEHLLVAPILKQRYAVFFDRLTDWGPARRRAYASSSTRQRPTSHDLRAP